MTFYKFFQSNTCTKRGLECQPQYCLWLRTVSEEGEGAKGWMIEVRQLPGLSHLGQLKAISGFYNVRRLGVCGAKYPFQYRDTRGLLKKKKGMLDSYPAEDWAGLLSSGRTSLGIERSW